MKCLCPIYIISFVLTTVLFPAPVHCQSTDYPDIDLYESQRGKNTSETLVERQSYLMRTTPLDSLMANYARRGFDVARDTVSLFTLFEQTSIQKREELRTRYNELYATARTYNSKALLRMMDFIKVWLIGQVRELNDERNQACEDLARRCRRAGDDKLAVYTLMYVWRHNYFGQNYARSFADARSLEQALDYIGNDYPFKANGYLSMGTTYYQFKDYDHALTLLRKGLSLRNDRDFLASLRPVLLGWNHLAVYYEVQENLDSAAFYHRSVLSSEEAIADNPVNLDIAICNLGRVEMAKGNTDAAIAYLQAGLKHLEQNPPGDNWDFAHGVCLSLGECMLAKNNLPATAEYIAKVRPGLDVFPPLTQANRLKDLFALESKYHSRRGEFEKADVCLDSAKFYTERYEQLTSQNFITLGKQQLQEAEIELKTEEVARQRNIIVFVLVMLIVLAVGIVLLTRLYRKKQSAYRNLVEKNRQWAENERLEKVTLIPSRAQPVPEEDLTEESGNGNSNGNSKRPPTQKEEELIGRIHELMISKQIYRDSTLTLDLLARQLNVNRETVSRTINHATGKNFARFLNEYRIKESIRILSAARNHTVNFDDLSEQVGFNNRTSFHRAFKQITGLPPNEFKNKA